MRQKKSLVWHCLPVHFFFFLFLVGKMWLVVDNATLPSACDGRFCFLYFQVLKYRYALPPCPDWWGSAFLSCFQCLVSFSRKEDFIFEPWRWLPIHKAYVRVYRCVFIHTCIHIHMHTAYRHTKASPPDSASTHLNYLLPRFWSVFIQHDQHRILRLWYLALWWQEYEYLSVLL